MDISGKAKSPLQRRRVRSQLIGAPLFVAQVGLNNIQEALSEGDPVELETIKLADEGTMAELLQKLARAPFTSVLKLLSKMRSSQMLDGFHQVTEDLDFTQTVASLVGSCGKINCIKNDLVEAFRRRNTYGQFQHGQSMSLDVVLNEKTSDEVSEDKTGEEGPKSNKRGGIRQDPNRGRNLYCYDFQRGNCNRTYCKYAHICGKCRRPGHSMMQCYANAEDGSISSRAVPSRAVQDQNISRDDNEVPPHPRSRRDRPNV